MMSSMQGRCGVHKTSWVLVVVGALNWGLVGAFGFNVVSAIFGSGSLAERVVYVLVGLAGLVLLVGCRCKKCMAMNEACKRGSMGGNMGMGGMNKM